MDTRSNQVELFVEDCHFTMAPICPANAIVVPLALQTALSTGVAVPPTATGFTVTVVVPAVGSEDPDHDGLSNLLEAFYQTDPNNPDTDGDGVSDGDEVSQGRNPTGPGLLFDFGLSGIQAEKVASPADSTLPPPAD